MPPLGVQPASWLVAALALLSAYRLASAQQEDSNLCSCTDLLWKPEPSHAWEVVNWHSKLVAELNAAEAKGVSTLSASTCNSQKGSAPGMCMPSFHAGQCRQRGGITRTLHIT